MGRGHYRSQIPLFPHNIKVIVNLMKDYKQFKYEKYRIKFTTTPSYITDLIAV